MIPAFVSNRHDPEAGQYGDCVRACIASILELSTSDVPHFVGDGCNAETMFQRIRKFLNPLGFTVYVAAYEGATRDEILSGVADSNPDATYILIGSLGDADHAVVCQGDKVAHNPQWYPMPFVGPASNGYWVVMVIAKL